MTEWSYYKHFFCVGYSLDRVTGKRMLKLHSWLFVLLVFLIVKPFWYF